MSDAAVSPTESRSSDKRPPPPPREGQPQAHRENNSMSPGMQGLSDSWLGAGSSQAENRLRPPRQPVQQRREITSQSHDEDDPRPNAGRSDPTKRPNQPARAHEDNSERPRGAPRRSVQQRREITSQSRDEENPQEDQPARARGNNSRRPQEPDQSTEFSDLRRPRDIGGRPRDPPMSRVARALNLRAQNNPTTTLKGDTIASGNRKNGEWHSCHLEIEKLKKDVAELKQEIKRLRKEAAAQSKRKYELKAKELKLAAANSRRNHELQAQREGQEFELKKQTSKTPEQISAEQQARKARLNLAGEVLRTGARVALKAHASHEATKRTEIHRDMQAQVAARRKAEREAAQRDRSRPPATKKATVPASGSRTNPGPVDGEDSEPSY